MKASELRIGNLISYKGETVTLLGISDAGLCNVDKFKHYKDSLSEDISAFQPILLTEEWLGKFGYQYANENGQKFYWHLEMPYFQLRRDELSWLLWYDEDFEALISKMDIEFMHQLQNIFFYMTGMELTDNPSPSLSQSHP